jgi:hypothetical protein
MNEPLLFVRIPRTAGTSISIALQKVPNVVCHKHESLSSIVSRGVDIEQFYVCSFVRNPWDRLVSIYHHFKEGSRKSKRLAAIGDGTFRSFAEWAVSGDAPSIIDDTYSYKRSYASPQVDWLRVDGLQRADFIGKFERIQHDAGRLLCSLGAPSSIEQTNGTSHRHYREYYDNALRKRVGEFYAEDCDIWGYTFEG